MNAPRFKERLWLGAVGWLSIAAFAASVGIAYAAASSRLAGFVAGTVLGSAATIAAAAAAPRVTVSDAVRAGRATLPLTHCSGVKELTAPELAQLRRSPDARAGWWCAPGWVRTAVIIGLADDSDPHTFWVVATRRPAALASALAAAGVPRFDYGHPQSR